MSRVSASDVKTHELAALRQAHKTLSDEMRALRNDNFMLAQALRVYKYCRHGCEDCFCVKEARAALWEDDKPKTFAERKEA
jgi:hypothetical protein